MRWKLVIAASLLAAAAGAGACYAIVLVYPLAFDRGIQGWAVALPLLVPAAATAFAAVFVYRHTARRRALQAAAVALLASLLTLTALTLGSFFSRGQPHPEDLRFLPTNNT